MFWGRQITDGEGPPITKFLTEFYKSRSSWNMWQSLVTIGQATSNIIWAAKKENYSGKTEWPAASIAGGRPKQGLSERAPSSDCSLYHRRYIVLQWWDSCLTVKEVDNLPWRHVGDVDLFRETRNVKTNEDDVCNDKVDRTQRTRRRHYRYVDIAARHGRHADLAGQDDCLSFVDVVRHRSVLIDWRLTEAHCWNCSALYSQQKCVHAIILSFYYIYYYFILLSQLENIRCYQRPNLQRFLGIFLSIS